MLGLLGFDIQGKSEYMTVRMRADCRKCLVKQYSKHRIKPISFHRSDPFKRRSIKGKTIFYVICYLVALRQGD